MCSLVKSGYNSRSAGNSVYTVSQTWRPNLIPLTLELPWLSGKKKSFITPLPLLKPETLELSTGFG